MALNLQTLTSPTTSSDVIADIENPAASGDLVVTLKNLATESGATTNATQTVSAAQGTAVQGDTSYLVMDLVDDEYEFTTDAAIDGTIVVATTEGTYSAGISLDASTQYDLQARGVASTTLHSFFENIIGYLITPSPLSDSQVTNIEAYFVNKGAASRSAFGSVTSFFAAWYKCTSLTSFPLIDTSSGTTFGYAWYDCSLTSFPLIDTSSGTNFSYTWYNNDFETFPLLDTNNGRRFNGAWLNNSSLTSFPANFFDNWSPASISEGVFNQTWDGCGALTNTSVENILVSLSASDVYGTDDGTSGGNQLNDHTIDIDYDDTNTLTVSTNSAIRSLNNKDWKVNVNNVIRSGGGEMDLQGLYFFDAKSLSNGNVTTWDSSISTSTASLNLIGSQADSNDQPVADGTTVDFADNSDHITIPSTTQAGWQIAGTSRGTFAYKVNDNAVTELNLLGSLGDAAYRKTGDLYGIVLLPDDSTDDDIEDARKLLIDRGSQDGVAATSISDYFRSRADIVEFHDVDTSNVTSFSSAWRDCSSLTSFPTLDTSLGTNFYRAWYNCSSLTSFPTLDTSLGTNFNAAWINCNSLTSFPSLNTSSGTYFGYAWQNCSSLTSFPTLDTSSGTNFTQTWYNCSSLTSFPEINTSLGTDFSYAWYDCSSLTSFPLINTSSGKNFNQAWYQCTSLTSFPLINTSSGTSFTYTWYNCNSLTSFPAIDTSSGTSFTSAWRNCSSLTSFPAINTSSGMNFNGAWRDCSSLTSFPTLDTSLGTSFYATWLSCSSLTSFPAINTSLGTNFAYAWYGCSSLTSFPAINTSSGTRFDAAWRNCNSLETFPANFFDNWSPASISEGVFDLTWDGCTSLTAQSVENILVSLAASGVYASSDGTSGGTALTDNEIDIDYDGTTLSSATTSAIGTLQTVGWDISINGVIQ